jgi:coenzyme F420-reducing hydrogenase gamma subunit
MIQVSKPLIAFFDFTGCEGCQLTVIDSLQNHPEMLEAVEIVQFREAMSEKGDNYQIAFVEGSCSRPEDEERLLQIRQTAKFVIALGACAHMGGVNALRNWQSQDVVRRTVYGGLAKHFPAYKAKPIDAVITVDGVIPGCPIDQEDFIRFVKQLMHTGLPQLSDFPVCFECKLTENRCVFTNGSLCLGPITSAGCGAICPSFGQGCDGCRGLISNPNIGGLALAAGLYGMEKDVLTEKLKIFRTFQLHEERVS